jgi:predicted component of type VI protein secretion system
MTAPQPATVARALESASRLLDAADDLEAVLGRIAGDERIAELADRQAQTARRRLAELASELEAS